MDNKPINVVHLTYDMRIGGTEQVIRNIILGMQTNLDIHHSILCIEEPIGPFGEMLQEQGITIDSFQRKDGFDISLIGKIRKYIKQHKVDILHCHQYTPWSYGALAAAGTKTKVIFTEHGRFYPDSSSWKRKFINPVLSFLTNKITAISKATKEALVEFEFLNRDKIEVIYNGIEPLKPDMAKVKSLREELGITSNEMVLGTVSRFDPIKNHPMLLKAFSEVIKTHPNCKLLIVGDGEERPTIESLIAELGIREKVILAGYIKDPTHHIALMDIFLLPSLSEGTSMTLLESMSLGKPCIVTDAGGNSEIIAHQISGIVTPNNQILPYSSAILKLQTIENMLTDYSSHALSRFNQLFTVNSMCSFYKSLYKNCIINIKKCY